MSEQTWNSRKIGDERITDIQYRVLERLAMAKDSVGYQFIALDGVHGATLKALLKRDWMVGSGAKHAGFSHYQITSRGLKVYQQASVPIAKRNRDGTCPSCGSAQRGYYETGRRKAYCDACERSINRRAYALFGNQKNVETLCPGCGERPRHQSASGRINTYCLTCKRRRHRDYKRRKHVEIRERVENGEVILCRKCKKKPIYITENSVYDVCYDCQQAYMALYNKKRRDYRYKDGDL